MYLKNLSGRIVSTDNQEQIAILLQSGASPLSKEEECAHIIQRMSTAQSMNMGRDTLNPKAIFFSTVSEGSNGYGNSSKLIKREFEKKGIDPQTFFKSQKVALLYHNPYTVSSIESPIRIIYTMFESDKIPEDWIHHLQIADKVLVPSKWCQSIFKNQGIETTVVPLGYDQETYKPLERVRKPTDPFIFLHYEAFNARKGFLELFRAFTKEFDKTEPVRLILKTVQPIPPIPIIPSQYPNIEVITEKYNDGQMKNLLTRSDCFVFPSRGEGFGLTPLEAMATGIPAIIPNAHGITEYFDPSCMIEVQATDTCPALYSRYKNQDVGKMVVCDIPDLMRKMRYAYEHKKETAEMGIRASEFVKQWTIEKTVEKLSSIITQAIATPIAANRNIIHNLPLLKIT